MINILNSKIICLFQDTVVMVAVKEEPILLHRLRQRHLLQVEASKYFSINSMKIQ